MLLICTSLYMGNSLRAKRDITIAIFGLDGAGKSTYIDNLNEDEYDDNPLPTVGYNTRKITKGRYNIVLAEVGGGIHIRGVWPKYFAQSHALIYMIDGCSSTERIQETKEELHKVLRDSRMSCKPLLVLCNKDDQPRCISPHDLVTQLDLRHVLQESVDKSSGLVTELNARVWPCYCLRTPTVKQDPRLHKSLNWLLGKVTDDWSVLSQRVLEEHRVELEEKERERQARIAKRRQRIEEEERLEREAIALAEEETAETITPIPINTEKLVTAEISPPSPPSPLLSLQTKPNEITTHPPFVLPPLSTHSKIETVSLMSTNSTYPMLQPVLTTSNASSLNGGQEFSTFSPSSSVLTPLPSDSSCGREREGGLGGATSSKKSVKSTRSVKKARIIRRFRSQNNKLHPIDSDTSRKTNASTCNGESLSSFSSKPPLLSPWISNDVQLPIDNSLTVIRRDEEAKTNNNAISGNSNNERLGERGEVKGGKNDGQSAVSAMKLRKDILATPITNHSNHDMMSPTFTLPQDVLLSPPLSMDSS